MDVNGTKYHLLFGADDWDACLEAGGEAHPALEWDAASASMRLRRQAALFRRASRTEAPLTSAARRGSGRDHYGNWYWIDQDERSIRFLPAGARSSVRFWADADRAAGCTPVDTADFTACPPAPPPQLLLRGLAVTTRHYLVVGNVSERGLLIFDLHGGGAPLLIQWPEGTPFVPWDLAPTPDGGLLALDRDNLTYWQLDASFRLHADVDEDTAALFQPVAPPPDAPRPRPNLLPGAVYPAGYPLVSASPPELSAPISIEAGPDGSVLILDSDPETRDYSVIYEYRDGLLQASYSLEEAVEVADLDIGAGSGRLFSVMGHDFAYVRCCAGATLATPGCGCTGADPSDGEPPVTHMLFVAERDGNQALAFVMNRAEQRLEAQLDFYPLRRWVGKALVAAEGQVYYDFADRWVTLQPFVECYYAGRGVLTTPLDFAHEAVGRPFDSAETGCVWHRLLLDAQIPPGAAILVRARAADDRDLLPLTDWTAQPTPYLRSNGAELPFYDPWADWRSAEPFPERTGTWELLFQGIRGRYLQLELTFIGTGRTTPALRALRAWYPRFSYLERYLPAIYREDPDSASFLERFLANFEGFYTNLEDQIEQMAQLFDPRTTPPDALDWLACWLGLALDPLWSDERRRLFIRHASAFFRLRGTRAGLEIALRLYLERQVDATLFDPRCWGRSKVRIIERFQTRGSGGLAYGDPTDQGMRELRPLTPEDVAASAHRFSVLLPHAVSDEQLEMAERIIQLEKPVHTDFEIKRYWDLFRVGEARLGMDTELSDSLRFTPLRLGAGYLADSYLNAPYPFDIADRVISDRDRLGGFPAL